MNETERRGVLTRWISIDCALCEAELIRPLEDNEAPINAAYRSRWARRGERWTCPKCSAKTARTEKRCGYCHVVKPLSEFNKCAGRSDGLQNRCRECHAVASRIWRERNA